MIDEKFTTSQDFYDANRERFGAVTHTLDLKSLKENKCLHSQVKRISTQEVKCQLCSMGWYDEGKFVIDKGKITKILK